MPRRKPGSGQPESKTKAVNAGVRHQRHALLDRGEVIYGLHAAEAALANPRRSIKAAYVTGNALARIEPRLAARKLAPTVLKPVELDALLGGEGAIHQGIALFVEPLAQPGLEEFLDSLPQDAPAIVAMLDQVTDPHNMGAVLRSAAAFGLAALIVQTRHSPPLSGALAKAASGALEYVPVIEAVNLSQALSRLKESDFHCLGFDSAADHTFGEEAVASSRLVFVFGAEGKGLRRLVREHCDVICALPAPGPIKSLNISNAAAIVFYEASKQNRK